MTIYPPLSIYIAAHGKILYAGRRLSILTVQKGHMQWKRNVYLLSSILIRGPWVSQKYSTRLPAPPLHILCRPLFRLTHLGDVACFPREHTAFPYICVGLPACGPAVAVCGCAITYLRPARHQAVPSLQLLQTALSNDLHTCTLESQHRYLLRYIPRSAEA